MEVLDYHKLKIFKTVADLKSFSKAAEILFLSQPTVTLQIKKIENYLGVTLFQRKKNQLELTEEGKILYRYASKILDDYTQLENEISSLLSLSKSFLFIGASSTIGEYYLPEILSDFYKENPDIKVNLFVGNSKEVADGVLSKVFNIGLVEDNIESNKFDIRPFYIDEIILIASAKNNVPEVLKIDDLKKFKFVSREVGSGTRNVVEEALGTDLNTVMEVSSSKAIVNIVENTDFLAFVSKLVALKSLSEGFIKSINIENVSIKRKFSIITQKNVRLSFIENKFFVYLCKKGCI
ncbi:LysR family transcriptional regulator [Sulfurihydrogenibium azorense]|jgi:DNA-binding transcriptional LysR family regulator|uniref:LysR family transcriptional regulator n=1 Tax=Sulfurihydrogenibium azorense TaxID=309806 RepID=UPI002408F938|nr:LysR family transcriptional regulator [Sulfurihydrogenibium azorense]MDM7273440.1 LysR family transcriptional regulator [Sulfurihydrogenibium azorense]